VYVNQRGVYEQVRAYFDHCRSTYVDKRVIDEMIPWWTEKYWAPSSFTYTGTTAAEAIENSQTVYASSLEENLTRFTLHPATLWPITLPSRVYLITLKVVRFPTS